MYGRKQSASSLYCYLEDIMVKLKELKIKICFYPRFLIILPKSQSYLSSCDACDKILLSLNFLSKAVNRLQLCAGFLFVGIVAFTDTRKIHWDAKTLKNWHFMDIKMSRSGVTGQREKSLSLAPVLCPHSNTQDIYSS